MSPVLRPGQDRRPKVRRGRTGGGLAPAIGIALSLAACGETPAASSTDQATSRSLAPHAPSADLERAPERGFVGVVVAGESVSVEPRVEGRLIEVLARPGDRVRRGDPLARLDVRAAGHQLAGAQAALGEASRRLARRRKLARVRPDAVTAEEMDAARREVLQERARVAELRALRDEATVRAPFDGTVADRFLMPGAVCGPGRPLLRLVGEGEPRVRFAIPEERAGVLALGAPVEIRVGPSAIALRGRVSGLSPEVDAASRTVHAAATLEPPAGGAQATPSILTTGLLARVFPAPSAAAPTPSERP